MRRSPRLFVAENFVQRPITFKRSTLCDYGHPCVLLPQRHLAIRSNGATAIRLRSRLPSNASERIRIALEFAKKIQRTLAECRFWRRKWNWTEISWVTNRTIEACRGVTSDDLDTVFQKSTNFNDQVSVGVWPGDNDAPRPSDESMHPMFRAWLKSQILKNDG